jgi:Ca-activated chloride channel family protein
MKSMLLLLVSLAALTPVGAKESIQLRVSPERDRVLRSPDAEVVFQIDVLGADLKSPRRAPINLALVLDRSGSMAGAKLEKARQAACVAIDQLSGSDTFSLVVYDTHARVLIPPQPVEDARALKRKVEGIHSGGSTALYAGVKLGADQLSKYFSEKNVNRIILLSDGIANVGPSSPNDLARLGRNLKARSVNVTTVGLGDDYNENLMVALAEASAANYYYVKDTETLPKIFAEELGQIKSIVARNLRIIIELMPGVEPCEVIGFPEIRFNGRTAEIPAGEIYGGQHRSFLIRCRVPAAKEDEQQLGSVRLAYLDSAENKDASQSAAAVVKFTDDRSHSESSVRRDVAEQAALAKNAEARERALALQDAGKPAEAAAILDRQAAINLTGAAALKSERLQAETDSISKASEDLKQNGVFDKPSRKDFQYENYNLKYQKR